MSLWAGATLKGAMFHLLAALLLLLCLPELAHAGDRGEVFRQAKAATALVVAVDNARQSVSFGSGFFIDADGLLVTNAHVIEGSPRLYLYVHDQAVYRDPEVVAVDRDLDLAALSVPKANGPALNLAAEPPAEGTDVIAVGYPRITDILQMGFTLHATVVTGNVSGLARGRSRTQDRLAEFIQTTGAFNFGNSGGPLVRADSGEVVGMVVTTVPYLERAKDRSGATVGSVMMKSGISYSIPAPVIRQWLATNRLLPHPVPKPHQAWRTGAGSVEPEANRHFATGHLLHTIAMVLKKDRDLLTLAVRHYTVAIELRPDVPWIVRNLALAYSAMGRWAEALETFRKGLELDPEDPGLLTAAGSAWQQAGHGDQAAELYRTAIRLNPRDEDAHNHLGVLLWEMRRLDEAIVEFRLALDSEPTSAHATYNLGLALEAKGLREEAIKTWESFLAHGDRTSDADELVTTIREAATRLRASKVGTPSTVMLSTPAK
jgi:Flp pilus assembly protein TadD